VARRRAECKCVCASVEHQVTTTTKEAAFCNFDLTYLPCRRRPPPPSRYSLWWGRITRRLGTASNKACTKISRKKSWNEQEQTDRTKPNSNRTAWPGIWKRDVGVNRCYNCRRQKCDKERRPHDSAIYRFPSKEIQRTWNVKWQWHR